jgi:hypothetical protein
MKTYSIAGLKVNMRAWGKSLTQAEKYLIAPTDNVDFTLDIPDQVVDRLQEKQSHLTKESCLYIALSMSLSSHLLDHDGFVLHSSAIQYENNAYLFSADSGTGKSTHTGLWQKCFNDAKIINDDKPAIRRIDGKFYACGTPFSGSTPLNENVIVPLKAICFLERANENSIERITDNTTIIHKLLSQTLRRTGNDKTVKLLEILDTLLRDVPFYRLKCLPNEDAARLAYEVMSK